MSFWRSHCGYLKLTCRDCSMLKGHVSCRSLLVWSTQGPGPTNAGTADCKAYTHRVDPSDATSILNCSKYPLHDCKTASKCKHILWSWIIRAPDSTSCCTWTWHLLIFSDNGRQLKSRAREAPLRNTFKIERTCQSSNSHEWQPLPGPKEKTGLSVSQDELETSILQPISRQRPIIKERTGSSIIEGAAQEVGNLQKYNTRDTE